MNLRDRIERIADRLSWVAYLGTVLAFIYRTLTIEAKYSLLRKFQLLIFVMLFSLPLRIHYMRGYGFEG